MRLCILALLLLAFTVNADAGFRFRGATGGGVAITGITVDGNSSIGSFNSNAANALVGVSQAGVIAVQATGGSFTGTVALGSGCTSNADNASFQISTTLQTNGAQQPYRLHGSGSTYAICLVATQAGAAGSPFHQQFAITGVEAPGPSAALYANPYYTCSTNRYVNGSTGSDTYNGTSATYVSGTTGPWATIAKADATGTAGECVNIAAGTYALANESLAHGGSSASTTGYLVYRCATLGGCTITDIFKPFCAGLNCGGVYPDYLIFDGLTFSSSSPTNGNAQAISCYDNDSGTTSPGCHHWWAINNTISGYGQSGLQFNDSEYYYAIHNLIYNNSHDCSAAQGSGISFATLKVVSSYTPTADDTNNPAMGLVGPSFPFYDAIVWNVLYNNYFCAAGASNTDGNAIIRDENANTVTYTHPSLVAENVIYNNGAGAVHAFYAEYVTIANNSAYNSYLDTNNSGTARGQFDDNDGSNTTFLNNASYSVTGSSPLNYNSAFLMVASSDVATANVSFCTGSPAGGCNRVFNGAAFSCSTNQCGATASWVNVGNTSPGSISTQPNGTNFGLQSSSVAIGYGTTFTGNFPESADAGACYHTLTTCP